MFVAPRLEAKKDRLYARSGKPSNSLLLVLQNVYRSGRTFMRAV